VFEEKIQLALRNESIFLRIYILKGFLQSFPLMKEFIKYFLLNVLYELL